MSALPFLHTHSSPVLTIKETALIKRFFLSMQKSLAIPQPLQVAPSRARRQFAMRLAQRRAELESTREQEDDVEGVDVRADQEREVKEGHERFARMFEGIDDSSSDEEDGSMGGEGEEGEEIGRGRRRRRRPEEGVIVV